jgi:hypothetical protein
VVGWWMVCGVWLLVCGGWCMVWVLLGARDRVVRSPYLLSELSVPAHHSSPATVKVLFSQRRVVLTIGGCCGSCDAQAMLLMIPAPTAPHKHTSPSVHGAVCVLITYDVTDKASSLVYFQHTRLVTPMMEGINQY